MKILVINEPFVKDFCRTQRWAARTRGRVLRAPDWLAYSTAVLEKEGYEVKLYDFPAKGWEKDHLRELVKKEQPEVVLLDSTTPSIYSDIECAKICKQESACTVIMVGPHVSIMDEETLKIAEGAVDIIARGEYEYTVLEVVKKLEEKGEMGDVFGISYLDQKGNYVRNQDRPLIENLDELPFPAWHHLDVTKYFDGTKLYPYVDIIGGRGCPFQCMFCLWPQVMHGRKYRLRTAENIVDEMEYDLAHWPEIKKGEFFFEDDTFTVNRKRAYAICEEILRRKLRVTWSINSRADVVDFELFKLMKKAGCRLILVGFESGDQQMLQKMKKNITVERMKEFVDLVKKAGLQIHGCFVLGLPGETRETIEKTIQFALDTRMDTVQFSAAIPFPGTDYYQVCQEAGLIEAKDWSDWLNQGEQSTVINYPGLSKSEIEKNVDNGLKRFYFRPSYMARFILDTHSLSDLYRKFRGAKNFLSYLLTERKKA
ncbi:MAG: radical SAM protein [Deltaproteobacteria bacterium]|nr:radical SAM protein [Deltaproteobacteria bacterium]